MIIGYSCWGFLGAGVVDTPDGGRSHRRVLIDALTAAGHRVVLLQANRDLLEAGDRLEGAYEFDDGLPALDGLVLEWRWPIPGRNITACTEPGHTCDLHRQRELLGHYVSGRATPTLVWDKDRQLPPDAALRRHPAVTVCEAALRPAHGATTLLFPVDDAVLDAADPAELARLDRPTVLAYVGNQYDRDDHFDEYFVPAARGTPHLIAGKWGDTAAWPDLTFIGRVPFPQVEQIYRRALATVTLLPRRYREVGQMTQRLFEAVLAGCLPIVPADVREAAMFAPAALHAGSGQQVRDLCRELQSIAGGPAHRDLLAACLRRLEPNRVSRQAQRVVEVLTATR